jgi:sugar fermentation stimulation protein A
MSGWIEIAAPRLATVRSVPLRATFIERPHRFAARCTLRGGRVVEAHVPNPGRLTGVLAPRGQVLLDGPYPPARALPYTMVAARVGGSGITTRSRGRRQPSRAGHETCSSVWVGTNTLYANRVFPALLSGGLFPEFDGASIRAEVAHGRSRFDFQVGGMMIEVKSVTLTRIGFTTGARRQELAARTGCETAFGVAGAFPDAVSARAARHCDELAALCSSGHPAAIVFVAQRGDVESVAPEDDVDPVFGTAIRRAAEAGVLVLACALEIAPEGATRARRVPVLL